MVDTPKLTAAAVDDLARHCLFQPEECEDNQPPDDAIIVKGIVTSYGFHPGRIAEKKPKIAALLRQAPEAFHKDKGGGLSFLNLCVDKDEHQWGEHSNMEILVCLAIAAELGGYCAPRELWSAFPGGVPYVYFDVPEDA